MVFFSYYLTKLNYMFRNELGKESEVKDKFFEMIESNPKLEKAIFESNVDFDFDNLFHPGGFLDKISETDALASVFYGFKMRQEISVRDGGALNPTALAKMYQVGLGV